MDFRSNTRFFCFKKQLFDFYRAMFLPRAPKKNSSPSSEKMRVQITPQIWPTTFWKHRAFPSAWCSRSAAILRAPSQHPWMIFPVDWAILKRWKFEGVPGFLPPKRWFWRSSGWGMSSPDFLGEKGLWTESILFNFETQFLKRSMEKREKKAIYTPLQKSHKVLAQVETSLIYIVDPKQKHQTQFKLQHWCPRSCFSWGAGTKTTT